MIKSSRPQIFSALARRHARLFFIALVCWVISVQAHAGVRIVHVSTATELVAAIGGVGHPDFGEVDDVQILLAPGDYAMNQLPRIGEKYLACKFVDHYTPGNCFSAKTFEFR